MKVNIGTYSFGGIASYLGLGPTLLEKFQTIKSLGYDGVELLPVDLDNDVEDIKKWAQETGLEIVSIHAKPTEDIVKKMAALGGKAVIWAGTDFCNKEEALALAKDQGLSASGIGSTTLPEYWIKNHFREALSWIKYWGQKYLRLPLD